MSSAEENERLTRVGPGTPMGALLRRYWHPIGSRDEMERHPTRAVRLLGESFVLYRDGAGRLALVGERCPHRGASLLFGIPDESGIRCAYHGWRFERDGRCTHMPGHHEEYAQRRGLTIPAPRIEELGGLVFAYLGPEPAPPLPSWDLFLERGVPKEIASIDVPCNWLQIMENNLDTHVRWLHVRFHEFAREQAARLGAPVEPPIAVSPTERPSGDAARTSRPPLLSDAPWGFHWTVPLIFPTAVMTGQGRLPCLQLRVPIDDTHTRQWFYTSYELEPATIERLRPHYDDAVLDGARVPHFVVPTPPPPDGVVDYAAMSSNIVQDVLLVTSQGAVHDRTRETLGLRDAGVTHYRRLLLREMERVERGEDPLGTFRDLAPGDTLAIPRLPPFDATDLRGVRARPGERPLENVQWWSPLLSRLHEAGVDVNGLKFEAPEPRAAAAAPSSGHGPASGPPAPAPASTR